MESLSSSWQVFLHCSLKTRVVLPVLLTGSENWCIPNMLSVLGIPFVFVGALPWVTRTKWKRKRSVLPTSGSGSAEDGLGKKRHGQTPKDDYGALEQGNIWMRSWRMSVDYKWERMCLRTGMATVYCYPAEEQYFRTAVVEGNRSAIRNIGSWVSGGLLGFFHNCLQSRSTQKHRENGYKCKQTFEKWEYRCRGCYEFATWAENREIFLPHVESRLHNPRPFFWAISHYSRGFYNH